MPAVRTHDRRVWWKTVLGVAFTAVMLFPLYWMINVSLTERSAIRDGSLYPKAFTFEHYRTVLQDQLPYLGTSVVIGLGTVALTCSSRAGGLRAVEALRARSPPDQLPADRRPDDPRRRDGARLLQRLQRPRHARHRGRPDPGRLHDRGAVRGDALHRLHGRHPARAARGRTRRRRVVRAHLPRHRAAAVAQRRCHGRPVRVHLGLVGLPVRLHAQPQRRPAPDHDGPLRLHRLAEPPVGRADGDRRARLHSHRSCSSSPSATSPPV